jgi:hypothetical protein
VLHHLPAKPRLEHSDGARHVGQIVGENGLAQKRFGYPGAQDLGYLLHLFGGVKRTLSDEHRHPLTGVEHLGGPREIFRLRHHLRARKVGRGPEPGVLARRTDDRGEFLHVVGNNERRNRALCERDPAGPVDQVPDLRGVARHLYVLACHIIEEIGEVDLLVVGTTQSRTGLLADYRHDRLVVHLRVVQTVEEVYRAGTGSSHAHAQGTCTGVLGMRRGHECGGLLVADLHEVAAVAALAQGWRP